MEFMPCDPIANVEDARTVLRILPDIRVHVTVEVLLALYSEADQATRERHGERLTNDRVGEKRYVVWREPLTERKLQELGRTK